MLEANGTPLAGVFKPGRSVGCWLHSWRMDIINSRLDLDMIFVLFRAKSGRWIVGSPGILCEGWGGGGEAWTGSLF